MRLPSRRRRRLRVMESSDGALTPTISPSLGPSAEADTSSTVPLLSVSPFSPLEIAQQNVTK
jgi:hypothetical protein